MKLNFLKSPAKAKKVLKTFSLRMMEGGVDSSSNLKKKKIKNGCRFLR